MKFALSTICCLALLVVVAAADGGKFIPKSFYTMDAEGHKSDVHPISPHTANYLSRMRRHALTVQSTSTSSSNGGPIKFTVKNGKIGEGDQRSNGAPDKGHIVSTTGTIDKKGKVTYKIEEGYFKP